MESGDEVELEPENGTLETDPKANGFMSNINKDDEVSDSGVAVQADGDSSVDEPKVKEVDYPGEGNEGSVSATAIKDSNLQEKSGSDRGDQLKKAQKEQGGQNGHSKEFQKKRHVLSQSLSFPSKGHLGSGLRKGATVMRQPKDSSSIANGLLSFISIWFYETPTSWSNPVVSLQVFFLLRKLPQLLHMALGDHL
ncbi:hypothetical protein BHM03_00003256 [Ensete ventricosum]|nr:hypothetical protein BHM03_00003256 [Ensete ventricosum]